MKSLRKILEARKKKDLYMLAQLFNVEGRSKMRTGELVDAVYQVMKRYKRVSRGNGRPRFEFGACPDGLCRTIGRGATSEVMICDLSAKKNFIGIHADKFYDLEKRVFREIATIDPAFDYFVKPLCFNDADKSISMELMPTTMFDEVNKGMNTASFHSAILQIARGIHILHSLDIKTNQPDVTYSLCYADLKEENVLINTNNIAKLGDVGSIAIVVKPNGELTGPPMMTRTYCDPFFYSTPTKVHETMELHSLAVIIYHYFGHPQGVPTMPSFNGIDVKDLDKGQGRFVFEPEYREQIINEIRNDDKIPREVRELIIDMIQPYDRRIRIDEFIRRWESINLAEELRPNRIRLVRTAQAASFDPYRRVRIEDVN